jgi:hypothetical protein
VEDSAAPSNIRSAATTLIQRGREHVAQLDRMMEMVEAV